LASGKRALGEEKNPVMLFIRLPVHIAKVTVLMLLIVGTYYFLNVFFIKILGMDKESVPVPLEPVLFGILYGLYYFAIEAALKPAFGIFRKEKT
ncbi:MAG: hypothetical protein FWH38_08990, partial [Treponema sp.]|nr:hypothetical protein [Treponema sp.]